MIILVNWFLEISLHLSPAFYMESAEVCILKMHFGLNIKRSSSPLVWYVARGKAVYCSDQYEISLLAYCNPPKAPLTCLNIINAQHQPGWLFNNNNLSKIQNYNNFL